jgi:hypothetical protein
MIQEEKRKLNLVGIIISHFSLLLSSALLDRRRSVLKVHVEIPNPMNECNIK